MNERIKQLAEQAEFRLYEDDRVGTPKFGAYIQDGALEKFAELIVEECIDYCGENLSKTVGGALKIHFGVTE
jgi:uncharacterized protein YutE (UPF0331/DUF86 family)